MTFKLELNISEILAIVISFIAIVISIKNRRNSLRENIYNRQLDSFEEIQRKITNLVAIVYNYYENKEEKEYVKMHEKNDELTSYLESKAVLLPELTFNKIGEFNNIISAVILEERKVELREVSKKYVEIENEMRCFIGLEKLSKENRKLTR